MCVFERCCLVRVLTCIYYFHLIKIYFVILAATFLKNDEIAQNEPIILEFYLLYFQQLVSIGLGLTNIISEDVLCVGKCLDRSIAIKSI